MRKDGKHKVIPGLSLSGKEILQRIKNGSIKLDARGHYISDPQMSALSRLDKIDITRKAAENQKKIANIKTKLANGH